MPEFMEGRVRDRLSRNPDTEFAELNRYINVTEYTPNQLPPVERVVVDFGDGHAESDGI